MTAKSAVATPKQVSGGKDKEKGKLADMKPSTFAKIKPTYGKCLKVLWRDNLKDAKISVIKIMSETGYNVEAITQDGEMKTIQKIDFYPLEYVDEMKIDVKLPKGTKLKVLWKESLLNPKIELIQIHDEKNAWIDYYDAEGILHRNVAKYDLYVIDVIPGEEDAEDQSVEGGENVVEA